MPVLSIAEGLDRVLRCIGLLGMLLLPGCVTVYQPLVSLQRPTVINPELNNFDGVKLMIRCLPSDYTDSGDSEVLCSNMRGLFEAQGAKVEVEVPESDLPERDPSAVKADLVIELKSKEMHSENSALLWILCYASATLIPAVTEATFSQDVVLRDTDGFLLASDVLQGRFIRYFGLGFWGINSLMDLIVRSPEEKLTGSATPKKDFSRDFYAQLSQLTFQARMRSMVLRSFDPNAKVGPTDGPAKSPAAAKPAAQPAPVAAPDPYQPAPKVQPIVPKPIPLQKPAQNPASEWESAPFPPPKTPKK